MHDEHVQRLCTLACDVLMDPLHVLLVHLYGLHDVVLGDEVFHDVAKLMGERSSEQLDALAQYDGLVSEGQ